MHDVRQALRSFRTNPGFPIIAIALLALGAGANTAIFQLFDAIRLRTLPVRAPQELVELRIGRGIGVICFGKEGETLVVGGELGELVGLLAQGFILIVESGLDLIDHALNARLRQPIRSIGHREFVDVNGMRRQRAPCKEQNC